MKRNLMSFYSHTIVIRVKGNDISLTLNDISLTPVDIPMESNAIYCTGNDISFKQLTILLSLNGIGVKRNEKCLIFSYDDSLNLIN